MMQSRRLAAALLYLFLALSLGSADTVELRDNSLVRGTVESVTATEVIIRVGGNLQHLDRSQALRIQFNQASGGTAQ